MKKILKKTVKRIKLPVKFKLKIYRDARGYLFAYFDKYKKLSIGNLSYELFTFTKKKSVFRGLHFQKPQSAQDKLVILISGSTTNYVVNINSNSDFGKVYTFKLKSGDALWIPIGYCHGYKTTSNQVIINYKLSKKYNKKKYVGIKPEIFNINPNPCLRSKQDANWKTSIDKLKKVKWN